MRTVGHLYCHSTHTRWHVCTNTPRITASWCTSSHVLTEVWHAAAPYLCKQPFAHQEWMLQLYRGVHSLNVLSWLLCGKTCLARWRLLSSPAGKGVWCVLRATPEHGQAVSGGGGGGRGDRSGWRAGEKKTIYIVTINPLSMQHTQASDCLSVQRNHNNKHGVTCWSYLYAEHTCPSSSTGSAHHCVKHWSTDHVIDASHHVISVCDHVTTLIKQLYILQIFFFLSSRL